MPYYQDEQTARAEAAVAAFLQTEVANGNVSQDEAGSWTWNVNEFAWPIEISTDPSILDGYGTGDPMDCGADEDPCDQSQAFQCSLHHYFETGF